MQKGFQQIKIATRTFEVEFKHRPPDDITGDREELISTEQITIPDLGNREWEKRWIILSVWNNFATDKAKELGINQAFIFTEGFKELIIRLEINPFQDEEAKKLDVPKQAAYDDWLASVRKKV
ncbi:hypothetical protein [Microcoleus sp. MON2_D5]|uniref:hypothetical protein n=1 Tax=Microcoleus sp. MON2_D5 TaxID=2818833 RepID=UPI002FD3CAF0